MNKSLILAIIFQLSLITLNTPGYSSDVEMSIDQATLQQYIGAVKAYKNERTDLYEYQICQTCVNMVFEQFDELPHPIPICKEWKEDCCKIYLGTLEWSWSVIYPQIIIQESGIKLRGTLNVTYLGARGMIPFEVPAVVLFDNGLAQLELHIQQMISNVTVNVAGVFKNLGSVNLAPYFDTDLNLKGSFNTLESRTVTGRAEYVNVTLTNGVIKITGSAIF
jgi:hypothetical protein